MQQLPQTIILMRHGLAFEQSEWDGDDGDRPLTSEGKKKARQAASGLLTEYIPTTVVTSELVRAIQTADAFDVACADAGLDHPHRITTTTLDHSATFSAWKKFMEGLCAELGPDEIVLAVGHEPSMSRILAGHLGMKVPVFGFKKAGIAVLRPQQALDECELVAFVPPRFLRGMRS